MKIRARKYESGRRVYQLDAGVINGRRWQRVYDTKAEAEAARRELKDQLREQGEGSLSITPRERIQWSAAQERLEAVGATIDEAVDFFLEHGAAPVRGELAIEEAVEMMLEAKGREGLSSRYIQQLKSPCRAFARWVGGRTMVAEATTTDVKNWLQSNGWEPRTFNNYLTDVRTFFSWACDEGYLRQNPASQVKRRKVPDEEVEFLGMKECKALLSQLVLEQHWPCMPAVVVGMFCGLRPERELGLLDWDDVSDEVVVVKGKHAKARSRRVVELKPVVQAWLALVPKGKRKGHVCPPNWRRRWRNLRRDAGLYERWPHDGLRHTYATMHLGAFQNEAELQHQMGHVDAQMLFQSYRGLVTKKTASGFWELYPLTFGIKSKSVNQ